MKHSLADIAAAHGYELVPSAETVISGYVFRHRAQPILIYYSRRGGGSCSIRVKRPSGGQWSFHADSKIGEAHRLGDRETYVDALLAKYTPEAVYREMEDVLGERLGRAEATALDLQLDLDVFRALAKEKQP